MTDFIVLEEEDRPDEGVDECDILWDADPDCMHQIVTQPGVAVLRVVSVQVGFAINSDEG